MEDHPALLGQLLMLTALPTLRKPSGKTSVQPETSGKFGNLSRLPPSLTSIFQTSIPKFQASQISHSQLCFPHEEAVLSVEVWRFQSKYISWNSKACQPVGDSRSYVLAFGNKNPWRKSTTSCEQCFKQPKRYSVNVSLAIKSRLHLFVCFLGVQNLVQILCVARSTRFWRKNESSEWFSSVLLYSMTVCVLIFAKCLGPYFFKCAYWSRRCILKKVTTTTTTNN